MPAPIRRLTKAEIIWLTEHKCKHGHTYLSHYNCYLAEKPGGERVGFLDIEASNLAGDFGICFAYCIQDLASKTIVEYCVGPDEIVKHLDEQLARQFIKDVRKFDRLITYYGARFDVPFMRTRALFWNIPDFPEHGELKHNDHYFLIRNRFKLSSNRLVNACEVLTGHTTKSKISKLYWIKALQGDAKSLTYILDHCRRDVRDLKRLWLKTCRYGTLPNKSL